MEGIATDDGQIIHPELAELYGDYGVNVDANVPTEKVGEGLVVRDKSTDQQLSYVGQVATGILDRYPLDGALPEGATGEAAPHITPLQMAQGIGQLVSDANMAPEQANATETTAIPEVW